LHNFELTLHRSKIISTTTVKFELSMFGDLLPDLNLQEFL